ncbi:hypothetical protein B0H11DRAFT_1922937 [Mycena galericulata]|nr:hypothetical protein B0H11DRAFT_1922937 [Mycena galericulata]
MKYFKMTLAALIPIKLLIALPLGRKLSSDPQTMTERGQSRSPYGSRALNFLSGILPTVGSTLNAVTHEVSELEDGSGIVGSILNTLTGGNGSNLSLSSAGPSMEEGVDEDSNGSSE